MLICGNSNSSCPQDSLTILILNSDQGSITLSIGCRSMASCSSHSWHKLMSPHIPGDRTSPATSPLWRSLLPSYFVSKEQTKLTCICAGSVATLSDSWIGQEAMGTDWNTWKFVWMQENIFLLPGRLNTDTSCPEFPSLEIFKTWLDMGLSNLLSNLLKATYFEQGSWSRQSPKAPAKFSYSVIL